MNKTMKIALCIGLTGLGMFVWTHFAAAGKPTRPSPAPVVVTFTAGDVIAEPQPLVGPFNATIDFLKYIPYICHDSPAGGEEVLNFLQTQNPITYSSIAISLSKKGPLYDRVSFNVTIDGVVYYVTMNAFVSGTGVTSTPTLNIVNLLEGRFAISKDRKLAVVSGDPVRQVNLDFTMSK